MGRMEALLSDLATSKLCGAYFIFIRRRSAKRAVGCILLIAKEQRGLAQPTSVPGPNAPGQIYV